MLNLLSHSVFPWARWLRVGVCAVLLATTTVAAAETWVVTDRHHSVSGTPDRLIELDAPARIEAELSDRLPNDPEQAAALVQQRLDRNDSVLQQRLSLAYQDVADAQRLGITQVPAVVVDQRYVVYGEHDLARAVARIKQYRETPP
ncbi:TIGR03757 family integrating conjugative element protein [Billgrantia endophytica]|uniref:TIGR03757 family integrating conjugative element protein n=1 Tax=Billgrantia endophytica TaxID=2033802 RepID=A0A2N7U4C7_9GAMM|nr:TIGR03757 family integrating conjugative element protein [Halomonas endophytica]PMR75282.1 TIGR03757 family integrating conjugative element protein [Halomonas endophytica]